MICGTVVWEGGVSCNRDSNTINRRSTRRYSGDIQKKGLTTSPKRHTHCLYLVNILDYAFIFCHLYPRQATFVPCLINYLFATFILYYAGVRLQNGWGFVMELLPVYSSWKKTPPPLANVWYWHEKVISLFYTANRQIWQFDKKILTKKKEKKKEYTL